MSKLSKKCPIGSSVALTNIVVVEDVRAVVDSAALTVRAITVKRAAAVVEAVDPAVTTTAATIIAVTISRTRPPRVALIGGPIKNLPHLMLTPTVCVSSLMMQYSNHSLFNSLVFSRR